MYDTFREKAEAYAEKLRGFGAEVEVLCTSAPPFRHGRHYVVGTIAGEKVFMSFHEVCPDGTGWNLPDLVWAAGWPSP